MITVDEEIKTASQLKRVIRDAVMEYAKHNHISEIRIETQPIIINNNALTPELIDLQMNIDIDI
jgi:hypothetical protein